MEIKILHTADIQVNVRGRHLKRKIEYRKMLGRILGIAAEFRPDMLLIVGDVYEKWDANAEERDIITEFLNAAGEAHLPVVITPGNHDLLQSNYEYDPGDGTPTDMKNALDEQLARGSFSHVTYLDKTGFFDMGGVVLANWSHKSKYTVDKNQPYNPWDGDHKKNTDKFYIDLFHDPVKGCITWGGEVLMGNDGARVSVDSFKGDLALMGDIHKPGAYKTSKGTKAIYPSSPVLRDFSEGDYYENTTLVQSGNPQHGVNLVTIDTDSRKVTKMEFVGINQYQALHTITMDNGFPTPIDGFALVNAGDTNKVKINFEMEKAGGMVQLQALIKALRDNNNISEIDVNYSQSVQGSESLIKGDISTEDLHSKVFLTELAQKYSNAAFPEDRFPDKGKREELAARLSGLLGGAIQKLDTEQRKDDIVPGVLAIKNFTSFGDTTLDMRSLPKLVKVLGNNGTGKTNILRAIKWLCTDRIDARQKQSKRKQSALDMFNDKLDSDTTEVSMTVAINGVNYRLSRTIKREWKAGCKRHVKDWKQNISGLKTTFAIVNTDTGDTLDNNKAEAMRARAFGDYFEFTDMHVIDQAYLDDLVSRDSDKLVEWVLWHIGLNYFTQLQDSYADIKEGLFRGLAKPAINIQTAEVGIREAKSAIENHNKKNEGIADALNRAKEAKNIAEITVGSLQLQYVEFTENDLAVLKKDITVLESEIRSAETGMSANKKATAAKTTALDEANANGDALEKNLRDIEGAAKNLTARIGIINNNIKNTELNINNKQETINAIIDGHNRALAERTQQAERTVSDKKSIAAISKNTLENLYASILTSYNQTMENKVAEANQKALAIDTERESVKARTEHFTEHLTILENELVTLKTNKCPQCKQVLADGESIKKQEATQKKIDEKRNKIKSAKTELEVCANNLEKAKSAALAYSRAKIERGQLEDKLPAIYQANKDVSDRVRVAKENIVLADAACAQAVADYKKTTTTDTGLPADLTDKIKKTRAEKEELVKQMSAMVLDHNSANRENGEINDRYAAAKDALMRANAQKTALAQEIDYLARALKENETTLNVLLGDKVRRHALSLQEARNKELDIGLNRARGDLKAASTEVEQCQNTITVSEVAKSNLARDLADAERTLSQIWAWADAEAIDKYYREATGKKGLQKQVFDQVVQSMNTKLCNLLSTTNFRVMFDITDNYALKMVDLLGRESVRPMYLASGMEGTLPALILIVLVKSMKPNKNMGWLWIDEITGKINNGEDTKGTDSINKDYQAITFKILVEVSSHNKIMIIDHVINNNMFSHRINVIKDAQGIASIET